MMENQIVKYGIENKNGNLVVSSRIIANVFQKEYSKVLNTIDKLIKEGCRQNSPDPLFIENTYINEQNNQEYREYLITEFGFNMYIMNITGYFNYKLAYMQEFQRMKNELENKISLKDKLLVDIIKGYSKQIRT